MQNKIEKKRGIFYVHLEFFCTPVKVLTTDKIQVWMGLG